MGAMGGGGGGGGPPLDGGGGGGGGPAFPPGGGGGGGGGGIGPTSVSSLQKEKSLESKEFRKESSMTKTYFNCLRRTDAVVSSSTPLLLHCYTGRMFIFPSALSSSPCTKSTTSNLPSQIFCPIRSVGNRMMGRKDKFYKSPMMLRKDIIYKSPMSQRSEPNECGFADHEFA